MNRSMYLNFRCVLCFCIVISQLVISTGHSIQIDNKTMLVTHSNINQSDRHKESITNPEKAHSPENAIKSERHLLDIDKPLMSLANKRPDKENRLPGVQSVFTNYVNYMKALKGAQQSNDMRPYFIDAKDTKHNSNGFQRNQMSYRANPVMFKNTISNPMTEPFSWVRYHNNNPKIPLNIASTMIQSHNGREDQNRQSYAIETHHRVKRGFRSAVADRIAHGFGKRGSMLDVNVNRLPQVQRLLNHKSLDAEDDEDDVGLLFHLYRMYKRNIHPTLNTESTFNRAHGLENDSFRRLIQRLLSAVKDEQLSELREGPYA